MRAPERTSTDDAPTRARVADTVLRLGPATATVVADHLGLTAPAVRRHLDQLVAEGLLESREQRVVGPRGRGRPAKVFAISDAGRDQFAHSYDDLAVQALEFLAETGGDDAVSRFARARLQPLEQRLGEHLQGSSPEDRPDRLAEALTAEGFAASVGQTPAGTQMCQHHCPVAHVAEEFPQMCEAEAEMFSRLLGTHVQRLATIAHGDGVCTTHLPHARPSQPRPARSTAERLPS
ncbi:transcriptional regulator, ArsR family [Aeromicrobium marinum DSM 15272]|uniref:Transcriptional regulator, ArsR family n=1 Tax=Aeromicrobium marinum DSM 15272 TaxID=585531 RepID=E2SA20_9ACTN|nr:transcriptional regulator, ArsR family [Aeromicrobium marinum DSM 15272]